MKFPEYDKTISEIVESHYSEDWFDTIANLPIPCQFFYLSRNLISYTYILHHLDKSCLPLLILFFKVAHIRGDLVRKANRLRNLRVKFLNLSCVWCRRAGDLQDVLSQFFDFHKDEERKHIKNHQSPRKYEKENLSVCAWSCLYFLKVALDIPFSI